MLKTTITKLKRACTLAFVPRILKGDTRNPSPKFKKLSFGALRKAGKSTDTGSTDNEDECKKCKRIIELAFGPTKQADEGGVNKTDATEIRDSVKELINENLTQFVVTKPNKEKDSGTTADHIERERMTRERDILIEKELGDDDYKHNEYNRQKGEPIYIITEDYNAKKPNDKETEEKLAQKVEIIEEITHIDAADAKVEGFNSTLKMLDDKTPTVNIDGNINQQKNDSDISITLDEIAKKCLNSPSSEIDERLIKEMKGLGLPNTGPNDAPTVVNNNLVQMDPFKTPKDAMDVTEIKLENEKGKKQIGSEKVDKLYSSFELPSDTEKHINSDEELSPKLIHMQLYTYNNRPMLGLDSITEQDSVALAQKEDIQKYKGVLGTVEPSQVIIDPYDKKTLARDTEEIDLNSVGAPSIVPNEKIEDTSKIHSQEESYEAVSFSPNETYSLPVQRLTQPVLTVEVSLLGKPESTNYSGPKDMGQPPFPSFEAREEVCDFTHENSFVDSQSNGNRSSLITEPDCVLPNRTEQIFNYIQPAIDDSSALPVQNDDMKASYDPNYSTQIIEDEEEIGDSSNDVSSKSSGIVKDVHQPQCVLNPDLKKPFEEDKERYDSNASMSLGPVPKLNPGGEVALSELLRRVRERNRLEYCRDHELRIFRVHETVVDPIEGKCGKKTPPCPPPAPKCPPPSPCPPPPPRCPPTPPPCPKPCKPACPPPCPPKKSPCDKFKKYPITSIKESLMILIHLKSNAGPIHRCVLPMVIYNINDFRNIFKRNKAVLTNDVVTRLRCLGEALCLSQAVVFEETGSSTLAWARDFEPWTPIPSWPTPKRQKRKPFVCPKEGCKSLPPPKLSDPCKDDNPCVHFPKRCNFSITHLL